MAPDLDRDSDAERREQLTSVALKVAAVVLGIGIVVGLGSWVMVKSLGLDGGSSSGEPAAEGGVQPIEPLPSSALPVPSESVPEGEASSSPEPEKKKRKKGIELHASPMQVRQMERINLTGTWPGKDNLGLAVQRFEDGKWVDFGVQATVRVGTFETWVMTGREGEQRFRVYDPGSDTASNPVSIQVG